MFKIGDQVVVLSGFQSNVHGIISSIELDRNGVEIALIKVTENGECRDIIEEVKGLQLVGSYMKNPTPVDSFDITKYITEDQMKDIAARIYEEKITAFVDDVLERRTAPYGGIVDQILMATVERYVTKLSDNFEEDFLSKAKACVELNDPGNDLHTTFQEQLTFKLSNAADKYIDNNLPKIHDLMASTIQDAAKSFQIKDISARIAKKIDLTKMLSEIILEQNPT